MVAFELRDLYLCHAFLLFCEEEQVRVWVMAEVYAPLGADLVYAPLGVVDFWCVICKESQGREACKSMQFFSFQAL